MVVVGARSLSLNQAFQQRAEEAGRVRGKDEGSGRAGGTKIKNILPCPYYAPPLPGLSAAILERLQAVHIECLPLAS